MGKKGNANRSPSMTYQNGIFKVIGESAVPEASDTI